MFTINSKLFFSRFLLTVAEDSMTEMIMIMMVMMIMMIIIKLHHSSIN